MIYIEDESGLLTPELEQIIINVIKKTLSAEEYPYNSEINVLVVTDSEIRQINNKHRKIDKPTDVLSFPMEDEEILGDIVISIERAEVQRLEYGHSLEREIGFLSAHGALHLLGYDHETNEVEIIMFKKQDEILESLKLYR